MAQVEEIRRQGGDAVEAQCNVADAGAQEAAFELHLRTWGRLDAAVLNAGIVENGAAGFQRKQASMRKLQWMTEQLVYQCQLLV